MFMRLKSIHTALQHFYCELTVSQALPTTVHLGNQRMGNSERSSIQDFTEKAPDKQMAAAEEAAWFTNRLAGTLLSRGVMENFLYSLFSRLSHQN